MKKLVITLLNIVILIVVSCQTQDNIIKIENDDLKENLSILENSNYLQFSSYKAFIDSVEIMSALKTEELDAWEQRNNFVSLRKLRNEIILFENQQIDVEERLIKQNPNIKSTLKHKFSDLSKHLSDRLVITETEGINYLLFDPRMATLLNKDAIVRIGKSIAQFGPTYTKIIMDGNITLKENLSGLNEGNQTDNLLYLPYQSKYMPQYMGNSRMSGSFEKRCEQENTDHKLRLIGAVKGGVALWVISGTQTVQYDARIFIEMKFLRKTWYGSWVDHDTEGDYSSSGTLGIGSTCPCNSPRMQNNALPYDTGNKFQGKDHYVTKNYYMCWWQTDAIYPGYGLSINGTQKFYWMDMSCTAE